MQKTIGMWCDNNVQFICYPYTVHCRYQSEYIQPAHTLTCHSTRLPSHRQSISLVPVTLTRALHIYCVGDSAVKEGIIFMTGDCDRSVNLFVRQVVCNAYVVYKLTLRCKLWGF